MTNDCCRRSAPYSISVSGCEISYAATINSLGQFFIHHLITYNCTECHDFLLLGNTHSIANPQLQKESHETEVALRSTSTSTSSNSSSSFVM